ncbi:MAG: protein kinase [Polyangiaceae bacterium]|nr:protein kinase [Polyangiaceae bacterium]
MKPVPEGEPAPSDESSRGRIRSGTERTVTGALDATALPGAAETTLPGAGEGSAPRAAADPLGVAPTRPTADPPAVAAAIEPQPSTLRPFGPYTRVEVLAQQGSIGLVARGFNEGFGRWELLKFLRPELARDPEIVRQFRREGRVLAQLSHPNVVQVFATHLVDDRHCLALEFLEGRTLAAELDAAGGRLPVELGLELLTDAARGLAAAHEAGLLHRDLKPDNLFVCAAGKGRAGGLKLIDFGLATAARGARGDQELESETVGGTPLYMAPELWLGHDGSARSDLWALGTTFYRALAGVHPLRGTTVEEVRAEILAPESFPSLATRRPELPPALVRLVDRLVAKEAPARFESAAALVASLAEVRESARPRRLPAAGPYRGLGAYTEADRDVWFGREAEVVEIVERLRTQAGVVLVGPAAAGKTSLALAGVAPQVRDGALGGGVVWDVARVVPGARPARALAAALARPLSVGEDEICALVTREPQRLGEAARAALPPAAGMVIVVDPLDDLVAGADPGEARAVAAALASLLDAGGERVRVVACASIERLDRLAELEPLRALVSRGVHPVRALRGEALRRAIVEPARVAGYTLEDPAIADAIVAEAAALPAALPLVSLALRDWWEERGETERRLGSAAWASIGGLVGALVRHAEASFAALGAEDQPVALELLARLCGPERERLCLPRASLVDPAASGARGQAVLERLLSAKLAVETAAGVELAHDALVQAWPRLRAASRASRTDRELAERVRRAAAEWARDRHADGALWDGEAAARLLAWFADTSVPLGQVELEFIEAVRRRGARRRFAARATWLAVALAGIGIGLWAKAGERRASRELERTRQARLAERSAHAVDLRRLLVDRARLSLATDPAQALVAVRRAGELAADPLHDTLAWRARHAGVARALPLHAGGAEHVVAVGVARVFTSGADGHARIVHLGGPEITGVESLPKRPIVVSLAHGDELAVGDASGALHVVDARGKARAVGGCGGEVRRVALAAEGRVVAECAERAGAAASAGRLLVTGAGVAPVEVVGGVRASAAAPGAAWAVALAGERLAWVDVAAARADGELRAAGATAVAALGGDPRVAWLGYEDGRVARVEDAARAVEPAPVLVARVHTVSVTRWRAVAGREESAIERAFVVDVRGRAALVDAGQRAIAAFEGVASAVHWLPDRGVVAFARRDGSVTVASAYDGAVLGRLVGATRAIEAIGSSTVAGAEWLLAGSQDGGVRAWPLDGSAARLVVGPHAASGEATGLSADGSAHVRVSGARVEVRRAGSRADRRVADAREWVRASGAPVTSVAAGPLGRTVTWVDEAGALHRADGAVAARLVEGARVAAIGGETGVVVAVREAGGARALVVSREPGRVVELAPLSESATLLAPHQGDQRVAVAGPGGVVRVLDLEDGRLLEEVRFPVRGVPTALSASEQGVLALGMADGHVLVGGGPVGEGGMNGTLGAGAVSCLAWTSGGRALAVGLANGELRLLDTETRESFELFRAASPLVGCTRRARSDDLLILDATGAVYERVLDVGLAWLGREPDDPLDASRAGVFGWAGLASSRD